MVLEDSLRYLDDRILSVKKILNSLLDENIDVNDEKWWKSMYSASQELDQAHHNIQRSLKDLGG